MSHSMTSVNEDYVLCMLIFMSHDFLDKIEALVWLVTD